MRTDTTPLILPLLLLGARALLAPGLGGRLLLRGCLRLRPGRLFRQPRLLRRLLRRPALRLCSRLRLRPGLLLRNPRLLRCFRRRGEALLFEFHGLLLLPKGHLLPVQLLQPRAHEEQLVFEIRHRFHRRVALEGERAQAAEAAQGLQRWELLEGVLADVERSEALEARQVRPQRRQAVALEREPPQRSKAAEAIRRRELIRREVQIEEH
mmetsp:Transcript_4662/g.13662  ORF Transcript_4662/g.13662 Transcript_4662/m.13662 type:complete len:210 (-) Transcript_4662:488-1117(-)